MPVLGLLFLRYAYSRFKKVEEEILKDRPVRNGRVMPVEASDFAEKSALYGGADRILDSHGLRKELKKYVFTRKNQYGLKNVLSMWISD